MKILMITSEAVPFAKTGGLADVVTALSLELCKQGHDVRILLPRYYRIDKQMFTSSPLTTQITVGDRDVKVDFYEILHKDKDGTCQFYFLDNELYYGREGIYGPRPDEAFEDNAARYALLCRGAFQLCRELNWIPHVFHCHDWTAAPVCYLLQREERFREFSQSLGVLSIHNMGYQGIFRLNDARFIQDDMDSFQLSTLEFNGLLNFLKSGIMSAHKITTVSPTYAREIQNGQGFMLDGLLQYRKEDLTGILNGVDYSLWNPKTDAFLNGMNYSVTNRRNKGKLKNNLQREMNLPVDNSIPLIGIITRLVDQKGIWELFEREKGAVESLCKEGRVQFVVLGSGESWCEKELLRLHGLYDNFSCRIGYDNPLAHRIEGGADFFLMPSRYEPCGLNQIYSLKYGTLPIVRATGGLADTVENYDGKTGKGTGFVFYDLSPEIIENVVNWVADTWYAHRSHIEMMMTRAMKKSFTWDKAARLYFQVYEEGILKLNS